MKYETISAVAMLAGWLHAGSGADTAWSVQKGLWSQMPMESAGIDVVHREGSIVLEGTVSGLPQRNRAFAIAARLSPLVVQNELRIGKPFLHDGF